MGEITNWRKSLALALFGLMLLSSMSMFDTTAQDSKKIHSLAYTSHAAIYINGNANFTAANGVVSGSGIASDPYIIENWDINSTDNGIFIENANAFFIIRNCYIHDGGPLPGGIALNWCANGVLINNTCVNELAGISIYSSNNTLLIKNNCSSNIDRGIHILSSTNVTLINNTCMSNANAYGIYLGSSTHNTLINNTCSLNYFTGIYFDSSSNNTMIDNRCGSNTYDGIYLDSSSNNTLINNNCSSNDRTGIYFYDLSDNNTLNDNNCSSNGAFGMFFWYCNNNTLDDNNCSYNRWNGIYLYDVSDNNILIGNSCPSNGQDGIRITWSSNNTLVNNTFSSNGVGGITLFESNDDILRNNTMTNDGIIISGSLSGWTTHDIGTSNKVNGKPVHYYKNQSGMTVPAGAGQVILANCTDFVIENQNLSGASVGIAIEFCRNCTISNNTCNSNNYFGIFLGLSSNNTLTNNTCSGCWYGVQLSGSIDFGSNNNTLTDNNFSKNDFGIDITSASDNAMSWNRICNNSGYGIFLTSPGADRNMIWNNTFIGNNGAGSSYNPSHVQAYDSGTYNHWNVSGSPHGYGNYWSDWKTPDHIAPFGIVDNPYNISGSAGAKDYFPLALNDLDPPMTTVSLSGTLGANGWYTSSVTVSISATDNYSGVNATFYRMDTSGSWSNYSFSFVLSNDGNYTLQFYSKDNASNNEPVKSISVKIDKTNPILTINQTAGFETTATSTIISWNGSDATSNIDHFEVRIDGNTFTSVGMAMSHNFSGLADGSHNVTVKAIDGAGNEVNKTIQFTVDTGGGGGGGIDMLNLILVILVIGILVGIAIPAIFGMRRKAKESDAKAGVKDIGTSTAQMMEDTKEESGKKP